MLSIALGLSPGDKASTALESHTLVNYTQIGRYKPPKSKKKCVQLKLKIT